ncbi:hypothetical protein Hanom_Chr11g01022361 [Helianthus anomalus]
MEATAVVLLVLSDRFPVQQRNRVVARFSFGSGRGSDLLQFEFRVQSTQSTRGVDWSTQVNWSSSVQLRVWGLGSGSVKPGQKLAASGFGSIRLTSQQVILHFASGSVNSVNLISTSPR